MAFSEKYNFENSLFSRFSTWFMATRKSIEQKQKGLFKPFFLTKDKHKD